MAKTLSGSPELQQRFIQLFSKLETHASVFLDDKRFLEEIFRCGRLFSVVESFFEENQSLSIRLMYLKDVWSKHGKKTNYIEDLALQEYEYYHLFEALSDSRNINSFIHAFQEAPSKTVFLQRLSALKPSKKENCQSLYNNDHQKRPLSPNSNKENDPKRREF